jgi:hypothetical protein
VDAGDEASSRHSLARIFPDQLGMSESSHIDSPSTVGNAQPGLDNGNNGWTARFHESPEDPINDRRSIPLPSSSPLADSSLQFVAFEDQGIAVPSGSSLSGSLDFSNCETMALPSTTFGSPSALSPASAPPLGLSYQQVWKFNPALRHRCYVDGKGGIQAAPTPEKPHCLATFHAPKFLEVC